MSVTNIDRARSEPSFKTDRAAMRSDEVVVARSARGLVAPADCVTMARAKRRGLPIVTPDHAFEGGDVQVIST